MNLRRYLGLLPAPIPHAREYKGAAVALAIATGAKVTIALASITHSAALGTAFFFGVLCWTYSLSRSPFTGASRRLALRLA